MRIGIDISQSIYSGTGVGEYTVRLVEKLLKIDTENTYVLFFSNRKKFHRSDFKFLHKAPNAKYELHMFTIPIQILEFFWNRLHIIPIEWFVKNVDVFLTSDWLEPPTSHAKKVTTLHDLSVLKYPDAYDKKITSVHNRKLKWVIRESDMIMCDSKATKKDAMELLGITNERLKVVYLGIT
jgi:glycosyltransferase involved in cell wall biosynthesis